MNKLGIRGLACTGLASLLALVSSRASAQDCETDSDCEPGQVCEQSGGSALPCAPGEGGCLTIDASVQSDGYCTWREIVCSEDADCPEGLTCDISDAPCASDEPQCTPATEGECEYDEIDCTSDADCAERWECLTVTTEVCEASGCAGEGCSEPPVETCETEESSSCFPKRVDCSSDADCAGEWRCVMFPAEGADEDAPAAWQGAEKVCMPEGLARVLEGEVASSGGASSGDGKGGSTSDAAAESSSGSGDDDGCSVTNVGTGGGAASGWGTLAALGLSLGAIRRSRRKRR